MKKEHYVDMESPITGGRVKLVEDVEEHEFRKEKYNVYVRYYICEDTGEQFTADGMDDLMLNQLYGQYRVRHGIPFADEICSLRERYKLNCTQMGKILGFGMNQWRHYEMGAVPSESNGKIIVAIRNKQCMLSLFEASRAEFQDAEYEKIRENIISAPEYSIDNVERILFYGKTIRGQMNGFGEMNPAKLQSMVRYIIKKNGGKIFPTKLNKEMFYSDFIHYRQHGCSISGLQYMAIKFGPVPKRYETIYDNVDGITKEYLSLHGSEAVQLHCDSDNNESVLSSEEIEVIDNVVAMFSDKSVSETVTISHGEDAWKKYVDNHGTIPYNEAFALNCI